MIIRQHGGIYIDGDFHVIREDLEELIEKYDQIFTLEKEHIPLLSTSFFASIPNGPLVNALFQ
jgi:mannosyltransferase OCH1-like enzyme